MDYLNQVIGTVDFYSRDTYKYFMKYQYVDLQSILLILCIPPALYHYYVFFCWLFRKVHSGLGKSGVRTIETHTFESVYTQNFPESIRYGSDPFDSTWPGCQVILYLPSEGDFVRNACAWRLGDYLITTSHAIPADLADLYVGVPDKPVVRCGFKIAYDHDELCILEVPPSIFTTLSVKSARVGPTDNSMVRVTGCEAFRSTTTGLLSPTEVLAMYVYSGSTKAGYSGAPYMVGDNVVAAMHVSGGALGNLAISARYIQMVLQQLVIAPRERGKLRVYGPVVASSNTDFMPENALVRHQIGALTGKFGAVTPRAVYESKGKNKKGKGRNNKVVDDWYEEEFVRGSEIRARKSRVNPDEIEFQFNDHYYLVDDSSFDRLKDVASKRGVTVYLGNKLLVGPESLGVGLDDDDDDSFLDYRPTDSNFIPKSSHYIDRSEMSTIIRTCIHELTTSLESKLLNNIDIHLLKQPEKIMQQS